MAKAPGRRENSERMAKEYGISNEADAEWADGIIFGTPTRLGSSSTELKAFIDSRRSLVSRQAERWCLSIMLTHKQFAVLSYLPDEQFCIPPSTFMRLLRAPEHRPLHEAMRTPQGG
jgi:NADPH-dependent FMN reductase